jgi:hypothetical protein
MFTIIKTKGLNSSIEVGDEVKVTAIHNSEHLLYRPRSIVGMRGYVVNKRVTRTLETYLVNFPEALQLQFFDDELTKLY